MSDDLWTIGIVFDSAAVALGLFAAYVGWRRRLSGALTWVVGLLAGLVAARKLGPGLAAAILRDSPGCPAVVGVVVSHLAILAGVLLTVAVLGHALRKTLEALGLRRADSLFGLVVAELLVIACLALGLRVAAGTLPSVTFILDRQSLVAHLLLDLTEPWPSRPEVQVGRRGHDRRAATDVVRGPGESEATQVVISAADLPAPQGGVLGV